MTDGREPRNPVGVFKAETRRPYPSNQQRCIKVIVTEDPGRMAMRENRKRRLARLTAATVALAGLVTISGCGEAARQAAKEQGDEITLWTHTAGAEAELAAVKKIVADYNSSPEKKGTIRIQSFPQSSYNDSVISASTAGNLPCLVDVDQPNTPYWGWANVLAPLTDKALLKRTDQLMDSAKGTWNKKVYTVGYFDATTALFARKSVLQDLGIRVATVDKPWTREEMDQALAKLKASGKWTYPFEMGTADNKTEWYSYAYSPILQSFGGDLVDRHGYQSSQGVLNGPEAMEFARWMRSLVEKGYVNSKGGSDTALDFVNKKSGLLYGGIWSMSTIQQYAKDADDIVAMPMADFGHGSVAGGGSWTVGMTPTCNNKALAMDYIRFSLQDKYIAQMAKAGMNIPSTAAARKLLPEFSPGGSMEVFTRISRKYVMMRPETPAYNYISTEFRKTIGDIMNGADAQSGLNKAVNHIDGNIKGADGYTRK